MVVHFLTSAQICALRKAYYQRHHRHYEAQAVSDLSQTEVEQIRDLYNP